jgi:uncharacterized protein (DUF58 family)
LGGAYQSAFKGAGLIFEEVREYQAGDDVRMIDWNVTARMGRPYIKRFLEERESTLLLVVDLSASLDFGSAGRSKRQIIAELAALLALCAAVHRDRVGAILGTHQVERYIPPRQGPRHLQRLLRDLLVYQPRGRTTDLAVLLQTVCRTQRRRAVVVLLSDFLTSGYEVAFRRTARTHDLIAIRLTDPCEQHCPTWGLAQLQDAETGKYTLVDTADSDVRQAFAQRLAEHGQQLQRLASQAGIDLLTLSTADDCVRCLIRFFEQRRRRRWQRT